MLLWQIFVKGGNFSKIKLRAKFLIKEKCIQPRTSQAPESSTYTLADNQDSKSDSAIKKFKKLCCFVDTELSR